MEQIQWWKDNGFEPYECMLAMNYRPPNPCDVRWQDVEIFAAGVRPKDCGADDYPDVVDGERIR